MILNRYKTLTVFVVLACLFLASSAMAGNTVLNAAAVSYAREVGLANTVYTVPSGPTVSRAMQVLRPISANGGDFFLRVSLANGAVFATGGLPSAANIVQTITGNGVFTISLISVAADGDTFEDFKIQVNTQPTAFPTFTFDPNPALNTIKIRDVNNQLGTLNSIGISIATRDASSGNAIDVGGETASRSDGTTNWLQGASGVAVTTAPPSTAGTTVIDVTQPSAKTKFFVGGNQAVTTTRTDVSSFAVNASRGPKTQDGVTAFALTNFDLIKITVSGPLAGVTTLTWDNNGGSTKKVTYSVTATDVTNGFAVLNVPGANPDFNGTSAPLSVTVDGTTQLTPRQLSLAIDLVLAASGPAANSRNLFASAPQSNWVFNGSVLTAVFGNGNNGVFNTRYYLWNASGGLGKVTADVYTLPIGTAGSTKVGTVVIGNLQALSGMNVRLAEDILANITGVTLPYTTNGGNLTVVFTIEANGIIGRSNVFSNLFSYGVDGMQ